MCLLLGSGVVAQAKSCTSLVLYSLPSSISCSFFGGIFKLISLSIFFSKDCPVCFFVVVKVGWLLFADDSTT